MTPKDRVICYEQRKELCLIGRSVGQLLLIQVRPVLATMFVLVSLNKVLVLLTKGIRQESQLFRQLVFLLVFPFTCAQPSILCDQETGDESNKKST